MSGKDNLVCLVLSGGFGTRLRPLTLSKPKIMVEFCGKPFIEKQLEALSKAGVTTLILATNYLKEQIIYNVEIWKKQYNIDVKIVAEHPRPLGTAGPIALAREYLEGDEPFFVFNGDVICDYPLKELMEFHKSKNAEATILTTEAEDPSKFGVIVYDENRKVKEFVEKPKQFVGKEVNAGIYVLSPKILDRIQPVPTSIEKEIFPEVAKDGSLYCYPLKGFWADIGQPKDFLRGTSLYLTNQGTKNYIAEGVKMDNNNCDIGENVVIGPNCEIGDCVRLNNCVIMSGSVIQPGAVIEDSIIGWNCFIGKWAHVFGASVLGENITVEKGVSIRGAAILPNKSVSGHTLTPNKVIM